MIDLVEKFRLEFVSALEYAEKFSCAARAREYQVDALEQLTKLREKAGILKAEVIHVGNEDLANLLLSYECALEGTMAELRMWIDFKDDHPHAAWDNLISAQSRIRGAIQAHSAAGHLEKHAEYLEILEKVLFPPMLFTSLGLVVKHSSCSICGADYSECDHIKGKAYMGELCAIRIDDCIVREVSFVEHPANKFGGIIIIEDSEGRRDLMTWRLLEN